MPEYLLLTTMVFLIAPLIAIVIMNLFRQQLAEKFCFGLSLVVPLLQMVAAASCLVVLLSSGQDFIEFSFFWNHLLQADAARFSVDWLSLVVLFTIGLVSLIAILIAWRTLSSKKTSFCSLLMVAILGMNGITMVTDLFSLYVYLETTSIATVILITLYRNSQRLEGAFKFLLLNVMASIFWLVGLAIIFLEAGSLSFTAVAGLLSDWPSATESFLLTVGFVFWVTGVAIKAALLPFHGWLPDAYQSAPGAIALFLAGIVTKVSGAYVIVRLLYSVVGSVDSIRLIFSLLALLTIIYGGLAAFNQNDTKRLLAYSSISQIGYIVLGAATGTFWGIFGATLHIFSHAVFKTTLFINAIALEEQVGHSNLTQLGGLQSRMPVTSISSIFAFLSAAGIPPLVGFWSKLIIIIAVWQSGQPVFAGLALMASLLTASYFLRLQRQAFFGKLPLTLAEVKEAKGLLCWVVILLSLISIGMGLSFPFILLYLQAWGLL